MIVQKHFTSSFKRLNYMYVRENSYKLVDYANFQKTRLVAKTRVRHLISRLRKQQPRLYTQISRVEPLKGPK